MSPAEIEELRLTKGKSMMRFTNHDRTEVRAAAEHSMNGPLL